MPDQQRWKDLRSKFQAALDCWPVRQRCDTFEKNVMEAMILLLSEGIEDEEEDNG